MTTDWRETTWGDEISLEYGKALRGHDGSSGSYRVFGSNGPIGWTDRPLVPGPGVILGRKGAYRGVEFSPDPFFVIDTAYYVASKKQHDMRWLYYAIKHHKLGEIDDGSPIPSTTRSAVYHRELEVPPPAEQRAIAHILGTLDDKIEVNRRMGATLEAMARALFKSWFVDFDPVRAKAEGRDPGLPPDLAALFPDRLVETDDGDLPEGWRLGALQEIANVTMGASPDGRSYNDSGKGTPLVNGPSEYGEFFLEKRKWTTQPSKLCEPGDLIVCVRGSTTGRHAFADAQFCLGRGVAAVQGKNGCQAFVDSALLLSMDRLLERATGSVFPNLSAQDIKTFRLLVPGSSAL